MRFRSPRRVAARVAITMASLVIGCATPFDQRTWLEVRTPHFSIASSASRALTLELADKLELFHGAALELLGLGDFEPSVPTQAFIFANADGFRAFQVQPGSVGFFRAGPDRNYVAIDASSENSLAIAYHEYAHFLLTQASSLSYPSWYHEGLADFLSTLELEPDTAMLRVGRAPKTRVTTLLLGAPLSLKRMLTASDTRRWSSRAQAMFYAQAWAFTHWLFIGQPPGAPDRRAQLVEYLRLLNSGVAAEAAFEQSFGESMDALEPAFLRYAQVEQLHYARVAAPRRPLSRLKPRSLPAAEHLYLLADLALAIGPAPARDPERLLRRALQVDPNHAASAATLGWLLAQRGDPEANEQITAASRSGGDDPRVERALGEALHALALRADGEKRFEWLRKAEQHWQQSLRLETDQVAATLAIGRAALMRGTDLDRARDLVRKARAKRRGYAPLDLLLAELEIARGELQSARSLLADAVRYPHSGERETPDQTAWLNRMLEETGMGGIVDDPDAHLEAALEWLAPAAEARIEELTPLVAVRGRAGLGDALLHDVVLLIDESGSTDEPARFDVDGDGRVDKGRGCGDTIRAAELAAARKLVEQLDPATTRVAIASFSQEGIVRAPLDRPEAALAMIDTAVRSESRCLTGLPGTYRRTAARQELTPTRGASTSFAAALATALEAFTSRIEPGTRRQRSVLMLSDGAPNAGGIERAEQQSIEAADRLAEYGIRVHAYAIGAGAVNESSAYRKIAKRTGGRYVGVESFADAASALLEIKLSSLDSIALRNRTSGAAGRAVRTFPDGSFDGYVPLVPGWNEIEVSAQVRGRPTLASVRRVFYDRPEEPSDAQREAAQRLLDELRLRTTETELIPRRPQRASSGAVQIEVEPESEAPGATPTR